MASIYTYRNILHMNVRIDGKQYRKSTGLVDTKENKQKVQFEIMPGFITQLKEPTSNTKLKYYIDKFLEDKKHLSKEILTIGNKHTIEKLSNNQRM
ncbi:hypothetical protein KO488_02490 [Poseidonibacter lekithochrous]|uniref:hypothetical protein n=1 Tax=Poseidonibacter TaxID=2321187 RepID=UPI001C09D9E1|nr:MULTISPECIES: hypothetical protein [Poseidonibacter]MBU3013610.1 hypothetical protein [Poseidonibacter lekithochrous]MDO6826907.1 hypothetical protein [Poseidonibacter sp. 1_MG-2023]